MKIDMSCVEGDTQICRYTVAFINLKVIYEINVDRQIYSDVVSLQFADSRNFRGASKGEVILQ